MKKILIITVFLFFQIIIFGQNIDYKIYNTADILSKLENEEVNSEKCANINFYALSYLEILRQKLLETLESKKIKVFLYEQDGLPDNSVKKRFKIGHKNLKEFLKDSKMLSKIIFDLKGTNKYNLSKIYLKDNEKAYFEIDGEDDNRGYDWNTGYRVNLVGNLLEIAELIDITTYACE